MELSEPQVLAYLGQFAWPFLRLTGLFLTAPLFGSPLIPPMVRALLAAVYAAALALWLPTLPSFPGAPLAVFAAGAVQITYGALLGMCMQVIIAAAAGAGEVAGLAMGLSFAELQFRESPGATPVLYDILFWIGLLAFMAAGGPEFLFMAVAQSFAHGVTVAPFASWGALALLGGTLLSCAVQLAMPVLAVTLCVNLTVGLSTVFAPSMNLLTIGFPLLILAGLWTLTGSLGGMAPVLAHLMLTCQGTLTALLPHG
jgi:flagellar biosynthetic protein FliR